MRETNQGRAILMSGMNPFQVSLIAYFLKKEINIECVVMATTEMANAMPSQDWGLVLRDFLEVGSADPSEGIGTEAMDLFKGHYVALFNVAQEPGIVERILGKGIRGVFFDSDSLDTLGRGVRTLLNGERWRPREIKNREEDADAGTSQGRTLLTRREKEVLIYMTSGASNHEIAAQLNISPHTVKNHITNIYKKINVTNRLQACMWAADYLS